MVTNNKTTSEVINYDSTLEIKLFEHDSIERMAGYIVGYIDGLCRGKGLAICRCVQLVDMGKQCKCSYTSIKIIYDKKYGVDIDMLCLNVHSYMKSFNNENYEVINNGQKV